MNRSFAKGKTLFDQIPPVAIKKQTLRGEVYFEVKSTGYTAIQRTKSIYIVGRSRKFHAAYLQACKECQELPQYCIYIVSMKRQTCTCEHFRATKAYCKHVLGLAHALTKPHCITPNGEVIWKENPPMIAEFLTEAVVGNTAPQIEPDWDGEEAEPAIPLFTGFEINDLDKADWYLAKLTTLADEEKRLLEQHEKRITDIKRTRMGLMKRFDAEFEHYMRLKLSEQKGSTIRLPHGDVTIRKVAQSVSVNDKEEALAYILAGDENSELTDYIVQKIELDGAGYLKYAKDALKTDGEVLPGVLIKPASERLNYEGRAEYIKACEKEAK